MTDMRNLQILSLALLLLTACESNDGDDGRYTTDPVEPYVISFESLVDINGKKVVPGHASVDGYVGTNEYDGIFWGKPYAEDASINVYDDVMSDYKMFHGRLFADSGKAAWFGSYYDDGMQWGMGTPMDTWDGFVVSQICDMSATAVDYANQFSAWAAEGANSTNTFAAGYCPDTNYIDTSETPYMIPTIEFASQCEVQSLLVANSTVTYPYTASAEASLTLVISAYLGKTPVGEKRVELAGPAGKLSGWTKVECSFGGKVDKLVFTMDTRDELYPRYFCIDDITVAY